MLVLNLAELLERDAYLLDNLIELWSVYYDLVVLLCLFKRHDKRAKFFFWHGLDNWLDLVSCF